MTLWQAIHELKHWLRHDWLYFDQPNAFSIYGDSFRQCRYCGRFEKWSRRYNKWRCKKQ